MSFPLVPFRRESIIPRVRESMLYFSVGVWREPKRKVCLEIFAVIVISFTLIRHPGNEKETGAEMRPAIGSGIVTGHVSVSYRLIFFLSQVTVPEVFANVNSALVSFMF